MNTIHQLSQYALQELKDTYDADEIRSICNIIFLDVLRYTNIDIHIRKNEILNESFLDIFFNIIKLLKNGHPIQYIIGETEFSGLKFKLDASTLIPRPETEELTHLVRKHFPSLQNVLDIGTGSGCIAITLASAYPQAHVTGIDLSGQAVKIAQANAALNSVRVDFVVRDILHFEDYAWENYDLVISNPPYVRESEKQDMLGRVLDHEPHSALFVPDTDPLLFYRRIAEFGKKHLAPGGFLCFEINEALGEDMAKLLETKGYCHTEIRKDLYGKDRFAIAQKPKP